MKKILLLLIAALTMTIASAKDIKTVVLTTDPQMHCESCEKRIKENIRFEKGIKKIVTDVEHQTVTITYDADKTTVSVSRKLHQKNRPYFTFTMVLIQLKSSSRA